MEPTECEPVDTDEHDPLIAPTLEAQFRRNLKCRTDAARRNAARRKKSAFDHAAYRKTITETFAAELGLPTCAEYVEKGLFNYTLSRCKELCIELSWDCPRFRRIYTARARRILGNLRNPKNVNLRHRLATREVKYSQLAYMTSEQLFPELHQEIAGAIEDRAAAIRLNELRFKDMMGENTGMFRCGRCRSMNTTYYSLQTRGADEPMTNFITCLRCQNRWKC